MTFISERLEKLNRCEVKTVRGTNNDRKSAPTLSFSCIPLFFLVMLTLSLSLLLFPMGTISLLNQKGILFLGETMIIRGDAMPLSNTSSDNETAAVTLPAEKYLKFNVTFYLNESTKPIVVVDEDTGANVTFIRYEMPENVEKAFSSLDDEDKLLIWCGDTVWWVISNAPQSTGYLRILWAWSNIKEDELLPPGNTSIRAQDMCDSNTGRQLIGRRSDAGYGNTFPDGLDLVTADNRSVPDNESLFVKGWVAFYKKSNRPLIVVNSWGAHNYLDTFILVAIAVGLAPLVSLRKRRQR